MTGRVLSVAMLAMLSACGDGLPATPDATDSTTDERGLVSVQLIADSSWSGTARVFFQRADGTLALATHTDGAGRANALVPPGGSVTIVVPTGSVTWLYTYVDVQLGDELVLDIRRLRTLRAYTLEVPSDPGSKLYSAHMACDGYTYSVGLWLVSNVLTLDLPGCTGPGELLVLSDHPDRGLGYLFTTFEATDSRITLAGTYAPYARSEVAIRAPQAVTHAQVRQRIGAISLGTSLTLTHGTGMTSLMVPLPADARLVTQLDLSGESMDPPSITSSMSITTWGPATSRTELDVAHLLRPLTAAPAYDVAQRTLRWEEAEDGTPGDAVAARIEYYRETSGLAYRWTILAPRGDAAELRFPAIPEPALLPQPDDHPVVEALSLIELDGGYDRIRTRLLGRWRPQDPWPVDGASGTVRLQTWGGF